MSYEHTINVNIGGTGKHPIVSLWCMDCLVIIQDFDQVNPWVEIQKAVALHCSEPSRREVLIGKGDT